MHKKYSKKLTSLQNKKKQKLNFIETKQTLVNEILEKDIYKRNRKILFLL